MMRFQDVQKANRRLFRNLLLVAVGMFGFGFALVPLYDVFCQVTGLNGKTGRIAVAEAESRPVDTDRLVTIEFVATTNEDLPWEFAPLVHKLKVHPGEINQVTYYVRNRAGETIVGQAIPSLAPGVAAKYMNKTECFCFTQQTLQPYEVREMPVRFVVDRDLPREISTLTLSYTFFDAKRAGGVRAAGKVQDATLAGAASVAGNSTEDGGR